MHNEAPTQLITFYGGPADSSTATVDAAAIEVAVRHTGPGSPEHYRRSDEWSVHFSRPVFIPKSFPGLPGKQHATA